MSARTRWLGWSLPTVAVLAAVGASLSIARNTPEHPLVEPAIAPPMPAAWMAGPGRETIGAVGLVEAASEEIAIASHRAGVVAELRVLPGDAVAKGDLLFRLDDRAARAALRAREAELEEARGAVATLSAQLEDLEDQLARAERLTVGSSISEDTLMRRRFAVRTAEAERDAARLLVRSREAARDAARVELELLEVKSPIDGTVLQTNLRVGEYADAQRADSPLLVLGRLDPLHVRVEVDETDLPRLDPHAPAVASVRGDGARQAALRLVRVDPYVVPKRSLTGSTTERIDTRVLKIVYALEDPPFAAWPGQQVDVFLQAGEPMPPAAPAGPIAGLSR